MNEKYEREIINKENVLNQILNLEDSKTLFAVCLCDEGEVQDLEYQTITSIKDMIEDDSFLFLKQTELKKRLIKSTNGEI